MTTKPDTILKLISRKSGATTTQLQKATGWKAHSVRAAISGLRNAGHAIARAKNTKGVTIYSIADGGRQ